LGLFLTATTKPAPGKGGEREARLVLFSRQKARELIYRWSSGWRGLAFLIGQIAVDLAICMAYILTRRPPPNLSCHVRSSLSKVASKMSTPYNYQYPPSSWPAAALNTPHQGVMQAYPPEDKLINSMASMTITGGANQPYYQPPTYAASQQLPARDNVSPVHPACETRQYYFAPGSQINSSATIPQPSLVPYQTTNTPPSSVANARPLQQAYQPAQQSRYPQVPNSPYLVSTTCIQPSPV
jgi:hypothetical protein